MENCKDFEPGFKKMENFELNKNQREGRNTLILILSFLLITIFYIFKRNKYILITALILLSLCLFFFISDPILTIRMADYLVARNIKTNHILDKEKYFPQYKIYEEKFPIFKEELNKLLESSNQGKDVGFTKDTYGNSNIGRDVDKEKNRGWRIYHIMLGGKIIDSAKEHFPELIKNIKTHKQIKNVLISILDENTTIPIHTGYYKGIMRFMLALKVPKEREKCYLCVNGDKYSWKEGETILWDDNFPHKVFNKTSEQRVVIYMDLERPDLNYSGKFLNKTLDSVVYNSSIIKEEIKKTEKKQKIFNSKK